MDLPRVWGFAAMIVEDRKRTFASNLTSSHRAGIGAPSLHTLVTDEVDEGLEEGILHTQGTAREKLGATYWVPGGVLADRDVHGSTTSIQLALPLTHRAYLDELSEPTILVLGHYVAPSDWPFGSELGLPPGTGDVSVRSGGTALRSTASFGDLFTYFSYLVETTEPQAIAQPHQEAVEWIKTATGFSWERVGRLVGVTRQAVNAWRQGGPIADDHRRRLLEVRDVLERAAKRNRQPGGLAAWLDTPRGADARTPADLLEAGEAGRARLLALSSPSREVKALPQWARRGAREAYLKSRERVRALPPEQDGQLLAEASEDEDE